MSRYYRLRPPDHVNKANSQEDDGTVKIATLAGKGIAVEPGSARFSFVKRAGFARIALRAYSKSW